MTGPVLVRHPRAHRAGPTPCASPPAQPRTPYPKHVHHASARIRSQQSRGEG